MSENSGSATYWVVHRFRLAGRWVEENEKVELVPAAAAGPFSQGLITDVDPSKKSKTKSEVAE